MHVAPLSIYTRTKTVMARMSDCQFNIPVSEIRWLILRAFLVVLKRKQTNYPVILEQLRKTMFVFDFGFKEDQLARSRRIARLSAVTRATHEQDVFQHIFF